MPKNTEEENRNLKRRTTIRKANFHGKNTMMPIPAPIKENDEVLII